MKESTKFAYFLLGITFCLIMLGAVGLYLYDQIDVQIIIVINKLNRTVEVLPLGVA